MIMSQPMISIADFGAIGDGKTDNTIAIQQALGQAAITGGGVWVPSGRYATGMLQVPAYVGLFAAPTWSYHHNGGTEFLLNDDQAPCLLQLVASYGARIHGLGLNGQNLGSGISGIYSDGSSYAQENTFFIEHCRITGFSGDAISLDQVFGFTVRNNMMIFNQGHGLTFKRFDGWIQDNIFNNNEGWGIYGRPWNGSLTITGNRVEWNRQGGIRLSRGSHAQINNNYIDRSGGPGIQLDCGEPEDRPYGKAKAHSITGNIIHRSGANVEDDTLECCHLRLEYQHGVTVTGNTFTVGQDDGDVGRYSPSFGIVYSELQDSVIANNAWPHGAIQQFYLDGGGNDETLIIRDNSGSLFPLPVKTSV